jgi:hypothetical protein
VEKDRGLSSLLCGGAVEQSAKISLASETARDVELASPQKYCCSRSGVRRVLEARKVLAAADISLSFSGDSK